MMNPNFNEFVFSNKSSYFSGIINIKMCSESKCYNSCNKFSYYCDDCLFKNEKISISVDSFNFIGYSLYASNNKYNNNKIVFNKNQIISLHGGEIISNDEKNKRYGNNFNPFINTILNNSNDNSNIIIDSSLQHSLGILLKRSKNYDEINVELIVIYNHVIEEHNVYIKALRNIKNNEQLVVYFDGFFDYQSNNYSINIVSEIFIIDNYLKNNTMNYNYVYIFEHLIEKGLLTDIRYEKLRKYSKVKSYNSENVLFLKEEY